MYYCGEFKDSIVEKTFQSVYNNSFITTLQDGTDCVYIVPETLISKLYPIKSSNKIIWWLSVDNYLPDKNSKIYYLRLLQWLYHNGKNKKLFKSVKHCVQSYYAKNYLKDVQGIDESDIFYLSDYLNDDYLACNGNNGNRKNIILYNPRKGYEFTKKIIEAVPEYEFIALKSMNREQIISLMSMSKLYIDFGHHPGKDRMPREAAICGCCIITNKQGAAAFYEDVPIPEQYKFENSEDLEAIHRTITVCIKDYENRNKDFDNYRAFIRSEKNKFIEDTKKLIQLYT